MTTTTTCSLPQTLGVVVDRNQLRRPPPLLERFTGGKLFELARPQLAHGDNAGVAPAEPVVAAGGDRPLTHLRDIVLQPEEIGRLGVDVFEPDLPCGNPSRQFAVLGRPGATT